MINSLIPSSIILENDRALIRTLTAADYDFLLPFSLNEPELWYYSLRSGEGGENLALYLKSALEDKEKGNDYPFIIYDKLKDAYAGTTRFYDIQASYKTLQLGYTWYGADFQGTGLNKNCKYLLLQYAFEELGMERVEFRADSENSRSVAAMKSIGCTVEGILRNHMPNAQGGRRNSIILSILKEEWFNIVKAALKAKLLVPISLKI